MPNLDLTNIRSVAFALGGIFLTFIVWPVVSGFFGANVRRLAQEKKLDGFLVVAWDAAWSRTRNVLPGRQVVRERWWLWLGFGLSSGLGVSLWLLSLSEASLTSEDIKKAVAPIQAELDRTKQALVAAQQAQHITLLPPSTRAATEGGPAQPKLSPEESGTRLSIWESVSTSNLSLIISAYNSMDLAFARWPRLIDSVDGRKQLYQDIINTTAAFISACNKLEVLRSEYPDEQEIASALDIYPHAVTLFKASTDFSNAINSGADEIALRPLAVAFRREMNSMKDWFTSLNRTANVRMKELSETK